jgi:hypothetical protein
MVAMARPVVVVVDDEDASRWALARELEGRYGADYRLISGASPEDGLAGLEQLRGKAPKCRWSWLTSGWRARPARNSLRRCVDCIPPPGEAC